MILLKNEGVLPLRKHAIKKIALFGPGADELPLGENYTGPYKFKWTAEDVQTPLQYLREYFGSDAEVICAGDEQIEEIAAECDAAVYFTTAVEGEGMDRCNICLPSYTEAVQADGNALIVDKKAISVKVNQEESIRRMCAANKNAVVVLLNGAPIDMTGWIEDSKAVLEAWYPGEQGSRAICVRPAASFPSASPRA